MVPFFVVEFGILDLGSIPKILALFSLPGIFLAYVVAEVTKYYFIGWIGFFVGMITFYGAIGLTLDFLFHLLMGRRKGAV